MTASKRRIAFRTPLCDRLGIEVPVFSFSHSLEVTAAVSLAGGYGVFGATHDEPDQIREHARALKEMCEGRPFGLDLLLPTVGVEKNDRAAAEAAIPVFGKAAREFSKAMADVQTVLGDHQDAVVARTWIAKTASDCTPDVAFAAGMLADIETRAAEESRAEFPEVWDKASRRKLRTWL